ncbi:MULTISPECIES: LysE family translocator [Auritidibacter]|uniref:LysE family translocator n=1 Tax=Auritidibacter TaxID=1160973 RepID=UPI000D7299B8|nr:MULTISPECIES: LysE family translocator [Auritidibacter]PXA73856.1 lysine transporter LysE [Auritidibacter sp. NML120779]AXR74788.1 LysE family translocator [Auritidibacter sp. NML130574]NIH71195.1 threonine/homoserine/homoserine lactone efflux protein [Auritidibacter ignavus]PXA81129.1 lysine transporter LysE [Auritidibacter sp. NML120636]RMX22761.1 LysE family translocator [Auritidibacter ignavus]
MSVDTLLALAGYALVTSITPGPNNLMLLASGVNFGLRRTLPHLAGISTGFFVLVFSVALGFAQLFTTFPALYTLVRLVGAAYLLWLAWQIATAPSPTSENSQRRPMTFLGAAAFQWVNPKAWVMAVSASANYLPASIDLLQVCLIATVYALVNAPSVAIWALFGAQLRDWLGQPRTRRAFNIVMAILLVTTLYPMLTASL